MTDIIEDKPNFESCFAYNSALKYSCAILDEKLCDTRGRCPFFKTQEQFDADAAAAAEKNKGKWTKGLSSVKAKKVCGK